MSKIDDLIREFCPEGVPHYNLDEVFEIRGGYTPSKANGAFWKDGTVPWFRMEDIRLNGRVLNDAIQRVSPEAVKKETPFEADSLIVATTATIGEHALVTTPFVANQQFSILTRKNEFQSRVDPKFAFFVGFDLSEHCLRNTNVSGFASVNMEAFRKFKFPIPPLEVQREIVSILDKFTQLEAELEAELEARRTQYEVTRDRLLDFSGDLNQHPLSDSERNLTLGNIKYLSIGDVAQYSAERVAASSLSPETFVGVDNLIANKKGLKNSDYVPATGQLTKFSSGSVLVGNIRPYLRKIWLSDREGGCSGDVLCFKRTPEGEDLVSTGYLYHCLASENFFRFNVQNSKGAKMPRGDKRALLEFPLFLPPISVQNEIVTILDKLDALANDIAIGLPAELAARRKQYEYYRNKLLTFNELDAS